MARVDDKAMPLAIHVDHAIQPLHPGKVVHKTAETMDLRPISHYYTYTYTHWNEHMQNTGMYVLDTVLHYVQC